MSREEKKDFYKELIQECDGLIKSGQFHLVSQKISALNLSQVPRNHQQELAKICRRAGLTQQGLRLLQPIIRNDKATLDPPTAGEICEYSVLLSRNGSIQEALNLLEKVDPKETPEALLYRAYCHISNWDYALAVPLLETFLSSSADDYSKLIARVNLASSYLAVYELDQALDLLQVTLPLARALSSPRLYGNCLDLMGHVYFYKNDFSKAREYLNQALEIFGSGTSDDKLIVQKTAAFMQALEQSSLEPLNHFRQEASEARRWEWVRETDLYSAKVQFKQSLVDQLIFGSPLAAFRQRVQKELQASPSETYIFGQVDSKILDLQTGKVSTGDLNPGKKIHQIIALLLKDFYAPRTMGSLFAELYPNEYFDVNSSAKRVSQILFRARRWLEENNIPASILEQDGAYRFAIHGDFGVRLSLASSEIDNQALKWQQLAAAFPSAVSFKPQEACDRLGWTRSTFLRVLEWALQTGKAEKIGAGRWVQYKVLAPGKHSKSDAA